ncbi:hypothetical protein ABT236_22780 [Streptomyces sp. NPDC001523]|uniref:hypothetical protein n=1 Tax=Streptomyces sp. NPDC001523 TaxID=3154383 RepID=UPI0033284437
MSRPTNAGIANQGFLNAHYVNDGKVANEVVAGVPQCGSTPPPSPAPSVTGCYFNMRWSSLALTFSYPGNHRYYGNAWQAAANWSNLGTGLTVKAAAGQSASITFKDVYIKGNGWYAQADIPASWQVSNQKTVPQNPNHPTNIVVRVNQYYMDGLDDFHRTFVLTHEVGHALGLAHPDQYCGVQDNSIMRQGDGKTPSRTINTPQYYDRIELEQLYGLPRR